MAQGFSSSPQVGAAGKQDLSEDEVQAFVQAMFAEIAEPSFRDAATRRTPDSARGFSKDYADRDQPLANRAWSGEHLTCRASEQPEAADTHNRAKSDRWQIRSDVPA